MKRNGATLLEVLIALFVTAVGMLALLALFPAGAASMANAIQNNRASQAAANSTAIANFRDLRHDKTAAAASNFLNPDPANLPNNAASNGPSYPLFVDPAGQSNGLGKWLGGQSGIIRVGCSFADSTMHAVEWFTLLDDMPFGQDGMPVPITPQPIGSIKKVIERDNLYSWSYILRKPGLQADQVNVTLLIYYRRPVAGFAPNSSEATYQTTALAVGDNTAKTNKIVLAYNPAIGQTKPETRAGRWLLDNSLETTAVGIQSNGPVHANFYRIVSYTESPADAAGNKTVTMETQTPLLADVSRAVIIDNLIEVFNAGD